MTIKTLQRIHRLLKEEYDQIEGEYQLAKKMPMTQRKTTRTMRAR